MAMKSAIWLAPAFLLVWTVGCGKSPVAENETAPATANPAVAHESHGEAKTPADSDSYVAEPVVNAPAAVLPVTADSTPEMVVTEFLNAMKTGNDGVAAGLLTATAREETGKHSLAVQPPGSPTAEYEIGKGELSEDDPAVAQVGCVWTEKDAEGADHSEQVVWVLRKHEEGWRVFGMATQMPTRKEPVFFNFEDPAEMTALMETISQEMQEMAAAGSQENLNSPEEGGDEIRGAAKPDETENSLR
jgi:hypothetical protein